LSLPKRPVLNVSLVMADNRPLTVESAGTYWALSVTINVLYSLSHGYAINRGSLDLEGPLHGLDWAARGDPWVKVAVGSSLLSNFHGLIVLDSDAFVYQVEDAVEPYLSAWRMTGEKVDKILALSREENPRLFQVGGRFNTGVVIIMNTYTSHHLYRSWAYAVESSDKRTCAPRYKKQWSFEQKPFEICIYNKKAYRRHIVALPPGDPINLPRGKWIKHYPTYGYFLRNRRYSLQHGLLNAVYRLERWRTCETQGAERPLSCSRH